MNFSAPNIKDLKITNTTAQMPITEWQKVCLRLTKLEQKEKLAKKMEGMTLTQKKEFMLSVRQGKIKVE